MAMGSFDYRRRNLRGDKLTQAAQYRRPGEGQGSILNWGDGGDAGDEGNESDDVTAGGHALRSTRDRAYRERMGLELRHRCGVICL
jgi:hypothetical protein